MKNAQPASSRSRSTPDESPANNAPWWIYASLAALAVAPYLQTIHYGFVNFDDGVYVADNVVVQQGLTGSNWTWALTTMSAGNWHPITWLSHMLDCQMFGLRPGWHHLVNALLHGVNTILLFVVLRSMTGAAWRSALVAALFAVHPLHVESVAWIAERKDVLSTGFGLSAMWAYGKYVAAPSLLRYGLVTVLFALSLLSKPMLVTLPCILLLFDLWPLMRFSSENRPANDHPRAAWLIVEKLPLVALAAASSIVTLKAQDAGGAVAPIDALPLSERLANAAIAYFGYLRKAFWPVDLSVMYPLREHQTAAAALAVMAMLAVTIVVALLSRRRPWLAVGWLWFLGTLVPVIGLVQVGSQAMADRYTYVPLIGVFIMIAWSVPTPTATNRRWIMTAAAIILATLTALTVAQIQVWKDTTTLFEHAVRSTQGNYTAHNLLAGEFARKGDFSAARKHIDLSLQIRPNYAGARYNLGMLNLHQGDFANARDQFQLSLQSNERDPMTWNSLGLAQVNLKQIDEAVASYRQAIELNPHLVAAFANLGAALLARGKNAEAIEACETALRLQPDNADAHASLAAGLWNTGRADESIVHNRRALQLNPDLPNPRFNLGMSLLALGRLDEAIMHLEYAVRLNPRNETAQKALAAARRKRDAAGKP